MKPFRNLQFRRAIVISQSPATVVSKPQTVTSITNIQNVEHLKTEDIIDAAITKPIGTTSSVLSVEVPPSVPIHIKRGSLMSIFGINSMQLSSIKNSLEFISPLRHIFFGNFNFAYQRLISTSKFSVLLSTNRTSWFNFSKSTTNGTFSVLNLDGSNDWAILHKRNLQMFIGNSLIIQTAALPSRVSRRLTTALKLPKNTSTGLPRWYNYGYTLVAGRGQVGVTGNGSLFNVNLNEGEEILINIKNLLAITVNGAYDLQNCIIKYQPEGEVIEPSVKITNKYARTALNYLGLFKQKTFNYIVGNENFVKVIGPRNLLVQSDAKFKVSELPTDKLTLKKFTNKSADYLNYVNVTAQKAGIKSTSNFRESLDKTK